MELDGYVCNDEEDVKSPNQASNQPMDNSNQTRKPINRAPSASVDPDFHRQAKRLKQKLKFTFRLLWITLAISGLTLILLVIQWVSIAHMRKGI